MKQYRPVNPETDLGKIIEVRNSRHRSWTRGHTLTGIITQDGVVVNYRTGRKVWDYARILLEEDPPQENYDSIYNDSPTEEDYPRFPLPCVVRNFCKDPWERAFLREISSKDGVYLVTDSPEPISTENRAAAYRYCRIRKEQPNSVIQEIGKTMPVPPPKADDDLYRNVDFSDIGKTVEVRDFTCQEWSKQTLTALDPKKTEQYHAGGKWWQYARILKEEPANPPSPPQEKPLQSHVAARFDCIDPVVLKLLAECLGYGAEKYSPFNYLRIPVEDHINHALNHINEHRRLHQVEELNSEDELHLVHALARVLFAISTLVQQGQYTVKYTHPEKLNE